MSRMLDRLRKETGASLVEYALIASLIALPSVGAMNAISASMNAEFNAIEDNAASAGHGTTTTAGATTTTAGFIPTPTTTSTTTTPPPSSTTTTTTTTATTVPATTTTTAPPPTTTTIPGAPAYQSETVDTDGGWVEFELVDGEINIADYDLNRRWQGSQTRNPDGSLTVHLWKNGRHVYIHAYVDSNGYLTITVS